MVRSTTSRALAAVLTSVFLALLAVLSIAAAKPQVGTALSPPLPDPVTMSATRMFPAGLTGDLISDSVLPIDDEDWVDLTVGDLASESGARADLYRLPGELRVSVVPNAGLYNATIERLGNEGAQAGTIQLRVRDWIGWAIGTAVAGILV